MKKYSFNWHFVLILLLFAGSFAQTNQEATEDIYNDAAVFLEIELLRSSVDQFVTENKEPNFVIANFDEFESETPKPTWRSFKTREEFNAVNDTSPAYSSAEIWKIAGKIARAEFTYTSPSGDWVHYVTYTFRKNGGSAIVASELRTFYGNVSVKRTKLFDENGNLLKACEEIRELGSNKPLTLDEDFVDNEVPVYKNVSELPGI
ncbi:MAG: hypothetical protein ACK5NT_00725 [Pyrinomonadaceae bacterium]